MRGVRDEGLKVEVLRAGRRLTWAACAPIHESQNPQSSELRFRARLAEGVSEMELALV